MIQLREVHLPDDYPIFREWWEKHGWAPVPQAFLPPLGMVAMHEGKPVCAAWLLLAVNCPIAMMEWLVADPQADGRHILAGMRHIADFFAQRAVEPDLGYSAMLTAVRQSGLVKAYERCGFHVTDTGVTHMLRIIAAVQYSKEGT